MRNLKSSYNELEIDNIPMRRYAIWTYEETAKLLSMFDCGCSVREICNELFRTPRGIAAKLVRLGRIENRKDILVPQEIGGIKGGLCYE